VLLVKLISGKAGEIAGVDVIEVKSILTGAVYTCCCSLLFPNKYKSFQYEVSNNVLLKVKLISYKAL
jgi:hypothetical protein